MKNSQNHMLLFLGVLLLAGSLGNAANLEHHMYWGVQAKDQIWAEFDPGFSSSLSFNWPPYDTMKLLTAKFYLIGLTLPDMFIPSRQVAICTTITKLYGAEQAIHDSLEEWNLGFLKQMFPLWITQSTCQDVQTRITFNGPMPNDNFQKMWEMAKYARDQGWTPYEKSLIYGALAHCTQFGNGTSKGIEQEEPVRVTRC